MSSSASPKNRKPGSRELAPENLQGPFNPDPARLNHSPTLTPGVLWAWDGEARLSVAEVLIVHLSMLSKFRISGSLLCKEDPDARKGSGIDFDLRRFAISLNAGCETSHTMLNCSKLHLLASCGIALLCLGARIDEC